MRCIASCRKASNGRSRVGKVPLQNSDIRALIAGREWLFGEYDSYVDASHLFGILRLAIESSDPETLRLALEMAEYGCCLSATFRTNTPPPFDDYCRDHAVYLKALLGQDVDAAIDHFRRKTDSAEVLVRLLLRLDRPARCRRSLRTVPARPGARASSAAPICPSYTSRRAISNAYRTSRASAMIPSDSCRPRSTPGLKNRQRVRIFHVLYLTEEEVKQLLPMKACVDMMRRAFEEMRAGRTRNQPRRRLILDTGSVLHQMAGSWGNYFVTKIYSSNRKYGVLQMINLLYDAETGKPLAYLEANNLGMIRTGAASGYATDLLAAPDASVVGLSAAAGRLADKWRPCARSGRSKKFACGAAKPRTPEIFAKEFELRVADSAEAAVRDAPIVVTATSSKDPVLESAWIKPGTLINAMGSNVANRREIPADLMRAAGRVVVDDLEQAKIEAGDIIMADSWANVVELKDVDRGHDPDHVTIFESLGIAVEDAAAAAYVYEQAVARKIGRPFP